MEQKKPIILQVDESTKKMISELEGRISEGFADALGELKGKISSSSDAIDALRTKLNRINDIQDSVDESSTKSDEIKRGIENLIKIVSSKLNVDVKEYTSDNPLDKQATKGDVENSVRESLANLENLKDSLTKSLSGFGERHLDSFTNLSSLIENVKSSISVLQEKQNDMADDVTSDFKNIVDTIDTLFAQGKEQISNIVSAITDTVNQTDSNLRQQFENSQAEQKNQFEQNQSALKSQSKQLSQNAEPLQNIQESLSTSFQEADGKLKDLANSLAASHKSYSDQMGASFDSSRNGIKAEFAHLNTIICENEERLIANTKAASDRITNNALSAKSEILSDNQEKAFQTLSSIKEFREFVDNRVTSVERECSAISKDVESFKESMASEVSIIKENQEYIQNTLNEVLYHSIPFWRFKARKAVKQLKKQ